MNPIFESGEYTGIYRAFAMTTKSRREQNAYIILYVFYNHYSYRYYNIVVVKNIIIPKQAQLVIRNYTII
jgi:hypothetical protein